MFVLLFYSLNNIYEWNMSGWYKLRYFYVVCVCLICNINLTLTIQLCYEV